MMKATARTSVVGTSRMEAQELATQLVRYRGDFRAFAREQLKIAGNTLEFWPCQIPIVEAVERQLADRGFVRLVCLKARQVGLSTLTQALVAWRTMLWPNVNAIVIADQAERSRTLFDIAKSFYEQMDEQIRPVGRYRTKRELVFANPSRVTGFRDPGLRSRIVIDSAHKKHIAIGANWTIAHLSECARFKDPKFVLDGILPAVHRVPGTMVILESSAEMAGTWYREFFEASQRGETAFEAIFVPWFLQPEYYICPVCQATFPKVCTNPTHLDQGARLMDLDGEERHIMTEYKLRPGHILWMREKLSEMGNDWNLFRQSFPLEPSDAWVTPGTQAFPAETLRELRKQIQPPARITDIGPGPSVSDNPSGKLWIWEEPRAGKAYDIGVDVASGTAESDDVTVSDDGLDWSVACVLERGSNKQVAEWRSKIVDALELASMLYWLGTYYNIAQIAVETNGMGGPTNAHLAKLSYLNQYIWRYRDEIVPRYSKKTGWETNSKSKPWLVTFAIHEATNNRTIIRSELLYREMETYVQEGPREWRAVAGKHDDAVTAWMIALIASDDECFERYFGLSSAMRAATRVGGVVAEKPRTPEVWEADLTFLKQSGIKMEVLPWD